MKLQRGFLPSVALPLLLLLASHEANGFSSFCLKAKATRSLQRSSVPYSLLSMASSVNSFLEDDDTGATAMFMSATKDNGEPRTRSLRSRLRKATGFSLTALRKTMRAATGISLTAIYASALAATSAFVRKTMALILSPLPPWFRYFLQPFLILYYVPIFIIRNLAGPTGKRARETHEIFVDGFKAAVDAAEQKAGGYWPVHVNGKFFRKECSVVVVNMCGEPRHD
jgi:hypothetical protein